MHTIRFIRGDRVDKKIVIKREDGSTYDLRPGEVVCLQVKKYADAAPIIDKKMNTQDDEGNVILSFFPDDTSDMHCGQYVYDIRLIRNAYEVYTIIEESPFIIDENVTEGYGE